MLGDLFMMSAWLTDFGQCQMIATIAVWRRSRPYNLQSSILSACSAQIASLFPFGSSLLAVFASILCHGHLAYCLERVLIIRQGICESSFFGCTRQTPVSNPTSLVLFRHQGLFLSHF